MTSTDVDLNLRVTDITGQKEILLHGSPSYTNETTVGEFITGLLPRMRLPSSDADGRPLVWRALLDREGRHVHGAERLLEVIEPGDLIVLHPNVDAG